MANGLKLYPKRKGEGLMDAVGGSSNVLNTIIQNITDNTIVKTEQILKLASFTVSGVIEIASQGETNTGTDTTRAICPDSLSGSIFGKKVVYLKVTPADTGLSTGDGKVFFTVPLTLNGMNLVDVDASVYTASSSGTPTIQIHNVTDSQDMLSTEITIDINELTSYTANTQPVINTSYDDVATGDAIRIDLDVAGTGTKGLDVTLTFAKP